jgi:hypothetical protein
MSASTLIVQAEELKVISLICFSRSLASLVTRRQIPAKGKPEFASTNTSSGDIELMKDEHSKLFQPLIQN